MLGILPSPTSSTFGTKSTYCALSKVKDFTNALFAKMSDFCAKNVSFHQFKHIFSSEVTNIASSIFAKTKTSSIFSTEENDAGAHTQTLQAAINEELGAHTVEFSDKSIETLPPRSVQVHIERISKSEIRFTANNSQSMISIIFDLIKLGIKHEESDRIFRQQQQKYMLVHMLNVVENLVNQANMILYASIAVGVLGILGGLLPIIGLMKGNAILKKLSKWFTSLKDAKQEKIFIPLSRSFDAASRTTEMGNRSQTTQAESIKTRLEAFSKKEEIGQSESTRMIEEKNRRRDSLFAMLDREMEARRQLTQSICK